MSVYNWQALSQSFFNRVAKRPTHVTHLNAVFQISVLRLDDDKKQFPSPLSPLLFDFVNPFSDSFLGFFFVCVRFVSPLFLFRICKTMAVRISGRKLSFEILSRSSSFEDDDDTLPSIRRSSSDPITGNNAAESPRDYGKRRRHRGSKKKKKKKTTEVETIPEDGDSHSAAIANGSVDDSSWVSCDFENSEIGGEREMFENRLNYFGGGGGGCVVTLLDGQTVHHNGFNFGELRQRNVNGTVDASNDERFSDTMTSDKKIYAEEKTGAELSSSENPPFQEVQNQFPRSETNVNTVARLDTEASLDWKQLMANDPDCKFQTFLLLSSLFVTSNTVIVAVRLLIIISVQ